MSNRYDYLRLDELVGKIDKLPPNSLTINQSDALDRLKYIVTNDTGDSSVQLFNQLEAAARLAKNKFSFRADQARFAADKERQEIYKAGALF